MRRKVEDSEFTVDLYLFNILLNKTIKGFVLVVFIPQATGRLVPTFFDHHDRIWVRPNITLFFKSEV